MRFLKMTLLIAAVLLFQGLQAGHLDNTTEKTGIITSINLEYKTMIIDQNEYRLSDNLSITTKDNIARGNGILNNGQKIKFWMGTEPHAEGEVIKMIQVLSEIKMPS